MCSSSFLLSRSLTGLTRRLSRRFELTLYIFVDVNFTMSVMIDTLNIEVHVAVTHVALTNDATDVEATATQWPRKVTPVVILKKLTLSLLKIMNISENLLKTQCVATRWTHVATIRMTTPLARLVKEILKKRWQR